MGKGKIRNDLDREKEQHAHSQLDNTYIYIAQKKVSTICKPLKRSALDGEMDTKNTE